MWGRAIYAETEITIKNSISYNNDPGDYLGNNGAILRYNPNYTS